MQQKKVAVVSGNNAAVQNVRDKLEAAGYSFLAASLGNTKNKNVSLLICLLRRLRAGKVRYRKKSFCLKYKSWMAVLPG